MWALVVKTDRKMMTMEAGVSARRGQLFTNYPGLMAGSVLAIWPMVLLYILFQKQFIEGIALAGIKA